MLCSDFKTTLFEISGLLQKAQEEDGEDGVSDRHVGVEVAGVRHQVAERTVVAAGVGASREWKTGFLQIQELLNLLGDFAATSKSIQII